MTRKLVVFFGNCQAQALAQVYRSHIGPHRNEITRHLDAHAADRSVLREADMVFEQVFDSPHSAVAD